MADIKLPNNDPDLILAQQLPEYIHKEAQPEISDPLFDVLVGYKKERLQSAEIDLAVSNNIWDAIESELESTQKDSKTNILKLSSPKLAWAVAASVLIIAFASIFYFMADYQPQLLANVNQQIQTTTLADGSTVTLRPHSKLYKVAINENSHIYKIEGEGFFEVQKNTNRTFAVEAGSGTVTVLGTSFNVSSWGNQTQVFLEEGSVEFSNTENTESVILEPGQSASINKQAEVRKVESSSADEFTDWMNKEIIFTNRTSEYIFQELEQQFNIEIIAPDSILAISLSGGISLENQDQSLNDLGKVLGGSFKKSQAGTFIFVSNN